MNNEIELLSCLEKCLKEKKYQNGLELILENENLVSKKYYDITKYKLIFLIKLNKLIDAKILINEELKVPYIPADFEKFIFEKQKEVNYILNDKNKVNLSIEDFENIDQADSDLLLFLIPHLKDFNIKNLVDKFQNIFNNESISYSIKSLLIAALSDYKLDANFTIVKEKTLIKFNPLTVFDIREGFNYLYINKQIEKLTNIEINVVDLIQRLAIIYLLYLYPLVISEDYCNDILLSAINLTSKMTNLDIDCTFLTNKHLIDQKRVEMIMEKMNILIESI